MDDLFGGEPGKAPAKRLAKAKASADGAVPECFRRWHELYELRWGMPPRHLAPGAAAGQFKRLVATYGAAEVLVLMARFFASTEWRIVRGGYTVGDFYNAAPALVLEDRKGPSGDVRTQENVDAARRATQRQGGSK